jgi:hypothetical protein
MYEGPNLRLNDTQLDFMLNDSRGEIGRHLSRIGDLILIGARAMVGVDTGRLKRALNKKHRRDTRGQYIEVGANVSHAFIHHEGTRPHVILPETGRVLRFRAGGRIVYARQIKHPGTRGRKYLTVPLSRVVR